MNVIEDNPFRTAWQGLGEEFGPQGRWPKPQAILCVSAHWNTRGWFLTGMESPKTIHDFGGFPDELFEQHYPAPGNPKLAADWAQRLRQPHDQSPLQIDLDQWGLDHGCWGVLKPMFPQADIAVIQLSIDIHQPAGLHLALGRQLAALRDEGVLILGTGNITHNMRIGFWQQEQGVGGQIHEGGDLRRGGVALHDLPHRPGGLVPAQVPAGEEGAEDVGPGVRRPRLGAHRGTVTRSRRPAGCAGAPRPPR